MAESNREEITKLEALYASNPGGRVFTHLAEAYRKAGNLARARTILEQGISKHADSASAHVVLGRVLSDLGAHEDAAVSYRRVLTLDPENRVALRSLGDLSRGAGEAHEALGYYRQLLHLDPSDEELSATIQELTREAARPAAAQADAGTPRTPAGAWVEPKPAAAERPGTATTVTPDFSLDWADQEEEEGLPGDLAHLARSQTAAEPLVRMPSHAPEVSFPPDIPDRDGTTGRVLEPAPPATEAFEPATTGLGEMEMQPASEAVEFAAEQQQLAPEPSFEDLLSRQPGEAAPLAAAAEEPELPTETLADLYRSQGFNDRAAEVYRTLLERKPGDPELERKLAEVEALQHPIAEPDVLARAEPEVEPEAVITDEPWAVSEELRQEEVLAAAPEEPAAVPAEEPEAEQAGEAWLEGVASGWTETAPAAGAETPYAWKDEAAEDQAGGPTLGNYLQKVLSWKPARTETPATNPLNTAPITLGYADATGTPAASPGSATAAKADVRTGTPEPLSQASPPMVGLPPVPMLGEAELPRATGPRETAAPEPPVIDDTAPAQVIGRTELSPPPPITAAPPTPSSRPPAARAPSGSPIDDAFDEWFAGAEMPQPSAPSSSAASPAATGPAGSARPEASADATDADDESDDDLEMFRSWLQSLKR